MALLGVTIDNYLKWNLHITEIVSVVVVCVWWHLWHSVCPVCQRLSLKLLGGYILCLCSGPIVGCPNNSWPVPTWVLQCKQKLEKHSRLDRAQLLLGRFYSWAGASILKKAKISITDILTVFICYISSGVCLTEVWAIRKSTIPSLARIVK